MLNSILAFSLKNRLLILVASILLSAYGAYVALRMPIDVLPDLNRPTVTIMAEAHAMVPEDVERLVVVPIERVLNGSMGITRVRSQSGLGLGVITAEFDWNTDIYRNRQVVQEKLQLVQAILPPDVSVQMAPVSSLMGQVQMIGVQSRSGKMDTTALRALVDTIVRPRLQSIPGVSQITSTGGAPKQLQITLDSARLRAFGVTLDEAAEAVRRANMNASGGLMNIGAKGPAISVNGRALDPEQFASAVVRADGVRPVRLADVGTVEFGPAAVRIGNAGINTKPGIAVVISKQPGVDTVKLTERVNAELAALQSSLPDDVVILNDVFQQAGFIHRAIDNVFDAVRDGTILVVVVLVVFLMNVRTTLITLTAIPVSVAVTAIVFDAFGLAINTMTLGGLAVAVGALVDDAVVDVENVYRRLRQNAALKSPEPPLLVIFRASSEVRKPILIGTLLVVVVYLPLFYMSGLEGRLFTPIGAAYIVSVLASLVVSLTLTPVLCYHLLGKTTRREDSADTWVVRKLKGISGAAIRFSMARAMPILGVLGAAALCGMLILATRGSEFLPSFNEGTAQVNLILPPEVGLETSDAYGRRLEELLAAVPGVKNIGRRTGRAEGDEHAMGVNVSEAIVTFDPAVNRPHEEIEAEIRKRMAEDFPGVATGTDQPLAHLLSHLLSGVNAQVAVKIFGPDLDVLRRTTSEVEAALKPIPGVKDLYAQPITLIDEVLVSPRREEMARLGVNVESVASVMELGGGSEEISRINLGQFSYPVVMRLRDEDRRDVEALRNLPLRSDRGELLRVGDVADVRLSKTPNMVLRENVSRRAVVQHNVAGRSLSEVVAEVEAALKPIREKLAATPGYSIQISGQFEAQAAATRLLVMLSTVSLALMFLILYLHFKSINLSLQVLLSIPMAFVGAAAYVVLSGQTLSVATLVGLVALGGIAARNAILLLDHYLHLMREEGEAFSMEMIVRAGQERMVPVLMTALCGGIGLVPLALAPGEPGREILYPVATVIIGGLISSTLLDFLVTPGVFWTFGRRDAQAHASEVRRPDPAARAFADDVLGPQTEQNDLHTETELAHG
jgi:CzcA family heavy metal efflux pump